MTPLAALPILLAQAGSPSDGGQGLLGLPLLLIAFGLIFYAIIIRPQQRQQREHREMVEAVQRNDLVVTSGGIHGRVTAVEADVITVEVAQGVRIRLNRSAVSSREPRSKAKEEKKS